MALFVAFYFYVIDVLGYRSWTLPFVVVGMNSMAMYVLVHVAADYVSQSFRTHMGTAPFAIFGEAFSPVLLGAATLLVLWLILLWMYRRQLFLRL